MIHWPLLAEFCSFQRPELAQLIVAMSEPASSRGAGQGSPHFSSAIAAPWGHKSKNYARRVERDMTGIGRESNAEAAR